MKTALLCVSFGTSVPAARKSITAVEEALHAQMPDADFFRVLRARPFGGFWRRKVRPCGAWTRRLCI